jgi:HCOMODA/2-hydroxy-3-carboxy-muconic semialdehyde decarboxylase
MQQAGGTSSDGPITDLLAGCAILDDVGLTSAFGHLSVRLDDDEVWMSPSSGPGSVRDEADLVCLSLSGEPVSGRHEAIPGEAAIHLGVLAHRADVGSVCRSHGAAALAWSTLGRLLPTTVGVGMSFGDRVRVFDTASTITQLERANELAEYLGEEGALLLRGFGAITVGATVREAVVRGWLMECSAAATLAATMAGEPLPYSADEAARQSGSPERAAKQTERIWNYLMNRAASTARQVATMSSR